jgi:CheY-like chemotaxis protein
MQHGALSTPGGKIEISWGIKQEQPRTVEMVWRESGGPAVVAPVGRGFGLTLIDRSRSLPNIKTSIAFQTSGVVAQILLEARGTSEPALFNPGEKLLRPRRLNERARRVAIRRVIIMDGSLSRALLLEDMLESAGYAVTGPLATAKAAMTELTAHPADLVALDVDEIGDSEINRLLVDLTKRHVPCIAIGTPSRLAQIKAGAYAALVAKPIDRETFLRAISSALDDAIEDDGDLL